MLKDGKESELRALQLVAALLLLVPVPVEVTYKLSTSLSLVPISSMRPPPTHSSILCLTRSSC